MAGLFTTKKANAVAVTGMLLKELGVKVSKSTIKNTLEDHPDYPSLLAVSDCLNEWGVANQTYQIEKEDFNNDELFFPYIAAINTNGGSFTVS